jgi:organic hydroperoxide reductase OsmC/OhrA
MISMSTQKEQTHSYKTTVKWTGNRGAGTTDYQTYSREHIISVDNKNDILCSSDPAFRGDNTRHNPEELLVSCISACHMLWYLHLCSQAGVIVTEYTDTATGIMKETVNGGGQFTEVALNPIVVVSDKTMIEEAHELHLKANQFCFIANSIKFPVHHNSTIHVK